MKPEIYKEAQKIWNNTDKEVPVDDYLFQLEIHKKLLAFFQVGNYYYFIFNLNKAKLDYVSPEMLDVLGYPLEETNIPFLLSIIHPEDQHWFLSFENNNREFFMQLSPNQIPNYKIRYDYRIKKSNGEYIRILQQTVAIQFDDDGHIFRTLVVHTDITHLKQEGNPVYSIIGLNGEPSYIDVPVVNHYLKKDNLLTQREREILYLLTEGKSSQEISKLLFISKHTVHAHRQNILNKTNCTNTPELISHAVKIGLI